MIAMADVVSQVMKLIASLSEDPLAAVRQRLATPSPTTAPVSVGTSVGRSRKTPKVKPACPHCRSVAVKGHARYRGRRRYKCLACSRTFNDLTSTPLSGVHSPEKMTSFGNLMARGGGSLRQSAKAFGIDLKTAFSWRHRIMEGYAPEASRKLKGIAEADETFFLLSEKGDKGVSHKRKARKRGGTASKAGISDEQVPVIFGCDRDGELFVGVAGRGRISLKDIESVLGSRIADGAVLCTDGHGSYKAFAKAHGIKFQPINISKGERVVKKIYHIQHVNSAHARAKAWMARFNGVATKNLAKYVGWFALMEEIKRYEDCERKFTERSVMQRRHLPEKPQSPPT